MRKKDSKEFLYFYRPNDKASIELVARFEREHLLVTHTSTGWIAQLTEHETVVSSDKGIPSVDLEDLVRDLSDLKDGSLLHHWIMWKNI